MTENEQREPRFEGEARAQAVRLGGVAAGDRPVASRALRRRGWPVIWLLALAVLAGAGWAAWHFTDLWPRLLAILPLSGTPERVSVDLVYETERVLDLLGLQPGRIDGELDPVTVDSIRLYQESAGLPATGEPSRELLEDMRAVAAEMADE